jgi:predicted neuraminidase
MRAFNSIALIVTLLGAMCMPAQGAAADDGFVPLFNGRDLSGWVPVNVAAGNTFTVKDGEIHCTGIPTGVMRSERMYENFIIELDWMHTVPAGNSGLFIWGDAITSPGVPFARGIEVQILDDAYFTPEMKKKGFATGHGDIFSIHGATCVPDRPHPGGWSRCLPSAHTTKPAGEWNHYHVECIDGSIKLTVNGTQVSGVSKSNPRKGYICLESEGGVIRFKNIRIKELPSTNAKPEETARADEGFKSIYTGVDLAGWIADEGHKGHFTAKDWILNCDGKSEAKDKTLWTEKEYGDFQMIVDWRLPAGGESGIYLRGDNALVKIPDGVKPDPGEAKGGEAKPPLQKKPGQWNRYMIAVIGNQLTVALNGGVLLETKLKDAPAKGKIGLVDRGSAVQFGNLYIRDLSAGRAQADPAVLRREFLYAQAPFPSVHASTIAAVKSGLVAAYFGGTREGDKDVGIWVNRQEDTSWTTPEEVANGKQPDGSRLPCWNPVLHANADGSLILFYKVGPSPSKWWGMATTSADGGKSWAAPWRLPDGFLGPIKNKAVILVDGTLMCPSSTEDAGWRAHMEFTRDGGHTFTKTEALNDGKEFGLIQPTILQMKQKLVALCRSKGLGKIVAMESTDQGKTWSKAEPLDLPNPNSGIDGVTLADGRSLLVYNHTPTGRSPLNVAVSMDGKTWKPAIVLEREKGEYSYPAIIQSPDGLVHITYTWKRQKVRHVVIDPKRIQ